MTLSNIEALLQEVETAAKSEGNGRLLLVEDDEGLREWLCNMLEMRGFQVKAAATGQEGLELLASFKPRVVVTDKNLPDINGVELIRQSKAIAPGVDFLLMTGDATLESAIAALNLGALGYVRKPIHTLDAIERPIRAALGQERVARVQELLERKLQTLEGELLERDIRIGTMEEVILETARERSRVFKRYLDEVLGPLRRTQDELHRLRRQHEGNAGELGQDDRLDALKTLVSRISEEMSARARQLAEDAGEAVPDDSFFEAP